MLIKYDKLRELVGTEYYDRVKQSHQGWVNEYLDNGPKSREGKWTNSIAVGSKGFVESVKSALGTRAKGRKTKEAGSNYELREPASPYGAFLGGKNEDIGAVTPIIGTLILNNQQDSVARPRKFPEIFCQGNPGQRNNLDLQ